MSRVIDTYKYGSPSCRAGTVPPSNYPKSWTYCVFKFNPFQLTVEDDEVFSSTGEIGLDIYHASGSNTTEIYFYNPNTVTNIAKAVLSPFNKGWFDIYRISNNQKIGRAYWTGYPFRKSETFYDRVLLTTHYEASLTSSSTSSSTSNSSVSSDEMSPKGITYYSSFRNYTSIANPDFGNSSLMQYSGFLKEDWSREEIDFDNFGYGLRKTKNNKGLIYCDDASALFSMEEGYVELVLNLPHAIVNGIYEPLINDNLDISEYILWGVNVGNYEIGQPGFYASLTPRGIEFTVFSGRTEFTIRDTESNVDANDNVLMQFFWGNDLYNIDGTTAMRINEGNTQVGNAPISNDDLSDINFCVLDTPTRYSNLECVIKRLSIYSCVPDFVKDEWESSSSTTSSSSSSSTSSSS